MDSTACGKARRWRLSPNFLAVAITTVIATGVTLAVSWYPLGETEISRAIDAPIGSAPSTDNRPNSSAAVGNGASPTVTPRDDAPLTEDGALASGHVEWTMAAGRWIADEIVRRAKDPNIADGTLHGEVERLIKKICAAHGGCDERQTFLLENSYTHNVLAYLDAASNDKKANAAWVGRTLIAEKEELPALEKFVEQSRTGHVRTLLVDAMSRGGDYADKDGLAYLMVMFRNESPLTDSLVFGWSHKLRALISTMTVAEADDVRYALRGYIANLRIQQREQKDPNDAALFAGLIAELEAIERDNPQE